MNSHTTCVHHHFCNLIVPCCVICVYFEQDLKIIVAQIKLYSGICKVSISFSELINVMFISIYMIQGVNKNSIAKLVGEEELLTVKTALSWLDDDTLDPSLKSAYIDFLIATLIDVNAEESGAKIDNLFLTFVS